MFGKRLSSAAALLLVLTPAAFAQPEVEIAMNARAALKQHCWRCHNGPNSMGGNFDMMNPATLMEHGVVSKDNPDQSMILQRIGNESMPPAEVREINPIGVADAERIRAWIKAGMPAFPAIEGRKFIYVEEVLTAIRDYLRYREAVDRPYLRFFTLHHLHNNPRYQDADLRIYRAALSKALNSVNWNVRPVLPMSIDKSEAFPPAQHNFLFDTVFVIDIRDYIASDSRGWERTKYWTLIERAYPYGLAYGDTRDPRLTRLERDLREVTDTPLFMLRADWFVATAMRPPLYDKLIGLPQYAYELEQYLGVDILANFLKPTPDRISRAGFAKSGISNQNRLVERHGSKFGAYWKSYDFKPGTKRGQLVRFPLGPRTLLADSKYPKTGDYLFDDQAFEHDGGEIVFNLPNGLQGYMLVDGHDQKIEAGPIDVVADPLKTSGTPLIVAGLSCMACHKHGMINFMDSIRTGSSVEGIAYTHVQKVYPEQRVMDPLVDLDRRRFLNTLDVVIGNYLRTGPGDITPVTVFPEPIGEVARTHKMVYLDLATVACELDFADPRDLVAKVGERYFIQLGLASLLKGGVISRNSWEASDGISLMQELALAAGFTPVR